MTCIRHSLDILKNISKIEKLLKDKRNKKKRLKPSKTDSKK